MRRSTVPGIALLLVVGATGVSLGASPAPGASVAPVTPVAAGTFHDLDAIFAPGVASIDLTVTQDEATRVSALIPAEGGTLEATAADGTRFSLHIPDGALIGPTTIGMAPLASVAGIPFGEPEVHAVQLEPSGLLLLAPATLRIEPAAPLALDEQIPIGFEGDGRGLFLAEPVVASPAIEIVVGHFSGYGVQKGLLADTAPARARLGGDAERRIESQVNEALIAERQRQQSGSTDDPADLASLFGDAFERYEAEVVEPRIAAAGESCANAQLAMETHLSLVRHRQQLGMESGPSRIAELLPTLTHVCVQEEYELCRDDHIIHRMLPVILSMEAARQVLGVSDPEGTASDRDLAGRCLTFRLDFGSNISTGAKGVSLQPSVEARVKLDADLDSHEITGTGVQEMVSLKVKVPRCATTPHPADADFEVLSLSWTVTDDVWQEKPGRIEDYTLVYNPGFAAESVTIKCPRVPALEAPLRMWYPSYIVAHESEWRDGVGSTGPGVRAEALLQAGFPDLGKLGMKVPRSFGNRLTLTGWEVQEAELLARQTWSKKALGGDIGDVGSFELHHTPG